MTTMKWFGLIIGFFGSQVLMNILDGFWPGGSFVLPVVAILSVGILYAVIRSSRID